MGKLLFDQYTVLHFAVGIIAYFFGISLLMTIVLHILFEIIENTDEGVQFISTKLGWLWPGGKDYADSGINQIGDTIGTTVGWLFAYWLDGVGRRREW